MDTDKKAGPSGRASGAGGAAAEAANAPVLAYLDGRQAHPDLAEVLVRHGRRTGPLQIVAVGSGAHRPLTSVRPDTGEIVACAAGMRSIGLRSGGTPPADARLAHREAPELGAGWWWVNPFDAEVNLSDTDAELRRWFRAAVGD